MAVGMSRSSSLFRGLGRRFRNKGSGRLMLPGITSGNTVEAINYSEALPRIRSIKSELIADRSNRSRRGDYFWLDLYILALLAQENWIYSKNDDLIASDIPWDNQANIPSVSSTIGDAASYAERLQDPKDHLLKALLLSFFGWTLLSTEKKECACGKGKLEDMSVDVLALTTLEIKREGSGDQILIGFNIGVQSDNLDHLERHYSFKEKSVRHENLIIIHLSVGRMYSPGSGKSAGFNLYPPELKQAEQFRANTMAELLDGLINSFNPVK